MFVEKDTPASADDRKRLELTNLRQVPVDGLYFSSRKRLFEACDRLRKLETPTFESDVKPSERYLMERFVTGGCRVRGIARPRAGYTEMDEPSMTTCDYRPRLRCMSIDIETEGLDGRLLSIAAVGLEELGFRRYPRISHLAHLFGLAAAENFGYRQLISFWRLHGMISALRGVRTWGEQERRGFDDASVSQRPQSGEIQGHD